MEYYNGLYEQFFQITISADDHKTCLDFTNLLKKATTAWFFETKIIGESKSARKGDVLKRELQIRQIAYATDIITFGQMLRTLIWHYNLIGVVKIVIFREEVLPKDSRLNLAGK